MEQERGNSIGLGYFNLARGLGMVMIVLGHSVNLFLTETVREPHLFSGAGSIAGGGLMAAFFMISGFGFYKRKPRKCIAIQARLLLQPYFAVAAAVLLTKAALAVVRGRSFLENGGELILTYLLGLNAEGGGELFGVPVESISIFWFVLALFGGWILYNGISQLKSGALRLFLILLCTAAGYFLTLLSKVWPFCLPMAFLAAGYLAAGDYIKKKGLLFARIPLLWRIGGCAVLLLSAAFGEVNIVAGVWCFGLIDVAATFAAGFVFLRIYAIYMRREHNGRITGALEEVGFHSIWIVCLHAYEKIIFPWYRLAAVFREYPVTGVLVCFALRCLVMYLLYRGILAAAGLAEKIREKRMGR